MVGNPAVAVARGDEGRDDTRRSDSGGLKTQEQPALVHAERQQPDAGQHQKRREAPELRPLTDLLVAIFRECGELFQSLDRLGVSGLGSGIPHLREQLAPERPGQGLVLRRDDAARFLQQMHGGQGCDHPRHRSGAPRRHPHPEERNARTEQQHADDREEVVAGLLNLVRLLRDHPERHRRAGLPAAHAARSFQRGCLEGLARRRDVAIHRVQAVAVAAYSDHLALHAHRVPSPINGVADQEPTQAPEDERSHKGGHLVQSGEGAEYEIKH